MNWWTYSALFLAVLVGACAGGLMGALAAERRLDRFQAREYARPRLNDQLAEDINGSSAPTTPGGGQ